MMIIGGAARNKVMVDCLREEIENLIVPGEAAFFEALGCAVWACSHATRRYGFRTYSGKRLNRFFISRPFPVSGRS